MSGTSRRPSPVAAVPPIRRRGYETKACRARLFPLEAGSEGVSAGAKTIAGTRRLVLAAEFFRGNTRRQGQCVTAHANAKTRLGIGEVPSEWPLSAHCRRTPDRLKPFWSVRSLGYSGRCQTLGVFAVRAAGMYR